MPTEITCIVTGDDDEYDDCRCITKLGYVDAMTGRQKMATPEEVYREIVEEGVTYYITFANGTRRAKLVPVNGEAKTYVRTERNQDTELDKLLKQPPC